MIKIRRCPECGRIPIQYTEIWTAHTITFDANPDGSAEAIGILNDGEPQSVLAKCSCGNEWKLRGVGQITDLRANDERMSEIM